MILRMCARFPLLARSEMIEWLFDIELDGERPMRHNIAPTQTVLGIRLEKGKRTPGLYRWGLIPSWASAPSLGPKMINVRSETVFEKAGFRESIRSRRCAVPCSGFYEWRNEETKSGEMTLFDAVSESPSSGKPRKEPLFFFSPGHELMAFAGLWDRWRDSEGRSLLTCTILTTEANPVVRPYHDRMPCLLTPDQVGEWISPNSTPDDLSSLLHPLREEMLQFKVMDKSLNDSKTEAKMDHSETLSKFSGAHQGA